MYNDKSLLGLWLEQGIDKDLLGPLFPRSAIYNLAFTQWCLKTILILPKPRQESGAEIPCNYNWLENYHRFWSPIFFPIFFLQPQHKLKPHTKVLGKRQKYTLQTYCESIWKIILLELAMYFIQSINTDKIRRTNQELAGIISLPLLLKVLTINSSITNPSDPFPSVLAQGGFAFIRYGCPKLEYHCKGACIFSAVSLLNGK